MPDQAAVAEAAVLSPSGVGFSHPSPFELVGSWDDTDEVYDLTPSANLGNDTTSDQYLDDDGVESTGL